MKRRAILAAAIGFALIACASPGGGRGVHLVDVARSNERWTGLAVPGDGRVFTCFPRWGDPIPCSVAEVLPSGEVAPYPDERWNSWSEGDDPSGRFVCVQSVVADGAGWLWVLDPASPRFAGVVEGGAKLVRIDLTRDAVARVYHFGADVAPRGSYLNDVRIDRERRRAYITDSGLGALVVVDLDDGSAWRVLEGHPSTKAEDVELTIGGQTWLRGGERPRVPVDGIAFDRDGGLLYYHALTARALYRVPVAALASAATSENVLTALVEKVAEPGACDGMLFAHGRVWLGSLEHDAILTVTPRGEVATVVRDPRLVWPDTLAMGPDGSIWVTTARIHEGFPPKEPYAIYRIADAPRGARPR